MATLILGAIGGAIGGSVTGAALGAALGKIAGATLGQDLDNFLFNGRFEDSTKLPMEDVEVQTMSYGKVIPIVFGYYKLAGNIIWSSTIKEHKKYKKHKKGKIFKKSYRERELNYTISLAIAICQGPVASLEKIWADDLLLDKKKNNIRFYRGDEEQMPDPLLESYFGINGTPAYRGLSYVVLQDVDLSLFNNKIPNFSFEVRVSLIEENDVENRVSAVTMIPGSGEFVYDTKIQYNCNGNIRNNIFISRGPYNYAINQHHNSLQSDALESLNQMKSVLPNVTWVSLVVVWFATSLNIRDCQILPGIEDREIFTTPDLWKVGNFTRNNAKLISQLKGRPQYGGTINDASLLRYLKELKDRGIKVVLYPLIMVDLKGKPWRGRITGEAKFITSFFKQYSKFIKHYAELVKNKVNGFLIGSELMGLTSIYDSDNNSFPFIDQLVTLAKDVKNIVGPNTKVSYAADWSEYHHYNGHYHLDSLWSSSYIDFIGIDCYFPLTDAKEQDDLSLDQVIAGWSTGEGYSFYYDGNGNKKPLSPKWAWKDISWWWSNYHVNSDGNQTNWQPKSKKIWFTEYGFASVNLSTNQPNLFYDNSSSESGLPHHSNGNIDMRSQRLGIEATEVFWSNSDMVERKFLWTWDARPYPTWPIREDIWSDSVNWAKGHWIQGKLGVVTLAKLLKSIMKNCDYIERCDFSDLDNITVHGFIISTTVDIANIIKSLQQIYGFDIIEDDWHLVFKRPQLPAKEKSFVIDERNLVIDKNHSKNILYETDDNVPSHLTLNFIDWQKYHKSSLTVDNNNRYQKKKRGLTIGLPLLLHKAESHQMANQILSNIHANKTTMKVNLPYNYININIGNYIILQEQYFRVIQKDIGVNKTIILKANPSFYLQDNNNKDYLNNINDRSKSNDINNYGKTIIEIFNLPNLPILKDEEKLNKTTKDSNDSNILYNNRLVFAACGTFSDWHGCLISYENEIVHIYNQATIGYCLNSINDHSSYMVDNDNYLIVNLLHGSLNSEDHQNFFSLNSDNIALLGDEIIKFAKVELIEPFQYKISYLLRGLYGTKSTSHNIATRFVILDDSLSEILLKDEKISLNFTLDSLNGDNNQVIKKTAIINKPLPPQHIVITQDGIMTWHNVNLANEDLFNYSKDNIAVEIQFFDHNDQLQFSKILRNNINFFDIKFIEKWHYVKVRHVISNSYCSDFVVIHDNKTRLN